MPPAVPLAVARFRCSRILSSIDRNRISRASARTAVAYASAREPLHPRLRLVPRTVQYRCPRSALGDETLRARRPLPERIPPSTYRVRLDAGQDRCFRHAARFYGPPRGVTRVALVPLTDQRNRAGGTVNSRLQLTAGRRANRNQLPKKIWPAQRTSGRAADQPKMT
jgi:hypothetical protein